ncbi:MAG: class I SAM-dependent methyltransferase [Pseudomonadota bacterium]
MTIETALERCIGEVDGLRVADLGCGTGSFTRRLARMGADVTGVEPRQSALLEALRKGGGPSYVLGGAETSGLPEAAFDLVMFSKSLHHCPDKEVALLAACRLLRRNGRVVVFEPVSPDPFWPVIRHIVDERAMHQEALRAVQELADHRFLKPTGSLTFTSRVRAMSLEAVIETILSTDANRRLDPRVRPAMEAAFEAVCQEDETGRYIPHWCRFDVLTLGPAARGEVELATVRSAAFPY